MAGAGKKRKKLRVSILVRIGVLFLAAMIISLGIIMLISEKKKYILNIVASQTTDAADAAATAAMVALHSKEGLDAVSIDDNIREDIHKTFRFICQRTSGVRYLYLYTVDEESNRHYLITAASDDADDARINETYRSGSADKHPLHDAEKEILSGEKEKAHEFIRNEYGYVCMYVVPVKYDGRIICMIGVDYSIEHIDDIMRVLRLNMVLTVIIVFGATIIIALMLIRRSVILPIFDISKSMRSFVHDNETIPEWRGGMFEDEITGIEESFMSMAGDIRQYLSDIEKLADANAQSRAQMDTARKIQEGIVPAELNFTGNGYDIYGCEHPAKEIGGDFYDIFRLDGERIAVVVGDISGKGLSAALFMVMVRTAVRENIKSGSSLYEALEKVNHEICKSNPENMFATVFAAVLDTRTGLLTYANAGHNPPLLFGNEVQFMQVDTGMALGIFDETDIKEESVQLKDRGGLLIYTDGITEAINAAKEQFGEERLKSAAEKRYRSAEKLCTSKNMTDAVTDSVNRFSEGLDQFDDITCVTLKYFYHGDEAEKLAPDIQAFVSVKENILSSYGLTDRAKEIILACEEIFSNIVSYSGADSIYFSCSRNNDRLIVTFSDNGIPFDPVNTPVKEKAFEDLDMGGMGIMLAKKYSDEMHYSRVGGRNVVTLEFF